MNLLWYIYNGPPGDLNMNCHLGSLNMNVPLGGLNMISLSAIKIYNGPLGSLNMIWKFEYESCWQLKYAMTLLGFLICADLDYECHPSSIFDKMVGTCGHDIIFIGI